MTSYVDQCVGTLIASDAHHVTKFISPKEIVRATRALYNKRLPRKGSNIDVRVIIGRPNNYRERIFIKDLLAAGEKFPVRKVWVIMPPRRK